MKAIITTTKELKNPHLEIDIRLNDGNVFIAIKHTCPNCEGYGCRNQACDDTIKLEPKDIIPTLGKDVVSLIDDLYSQITYDYHNSPHE